MFKIITLNIIPSHRNFHVERINFMPWIRVRKKQERPHWKALKIVTWVYGNEREMACPYNHSPRAAPVVVLGKADIDKFTAINKKW